MQRAHASAAIKSLLGRLQRSPLLPVPEWCHCRPRLAPGRAGRRGPTRDTGRRRRMKIGFFEDYKLGVILGDTIVDVSSAVAEIPHLGPHDLINGVIADYEAHRPRLEAAASRGKRIPLTSVRLRAPLPRPINIDCMAVNYMEDGTR